MYPVGTIVYLKSGSPPMTVADDLNKEGWVLCLWFDGKERREGQFPEDALTEQEPEDDL